MTARAVSEETRAIRNDNDQDLKREEIGCPVQGSEVQGFSPHGSAVLAFTQPAELRQARYFKTLLHAQRAQVQDELAWHCSRLVGLKGSNARGCMRHLTQQITEKRREEYELDCLIEALRQRFFPSAATPRKPARCFDVEVTYRRGSWTIHIPDIDATTKVCQRDQTELAARVYIAVNVGMPIREIAVRLRDHERGSGR